jgi:hypothetical protein
MLNYDNIPYGNRGNTFGQQQPLSLGGQTYGNMYNDMTGYSGTPFMGSMPNSGYNFSNIQYPVTAPMPILVRMEIRGFQIRHLPHQR